MFCLKLIINLIIFLFVNNILFFYSKGKNLIDEFIIFDYVDNLSDFYLNVIL